MERGGRGFIGRSVALWEGNIADTSKGGQIVNRKGVTISEYSKGATSDETVSDDRCISGW